MTRYRTFPSRARRLRPITELLEDRTLPSFSAPTFYATEEAPRAGAVADFNRDGALDLATVSFYTNAGSGRVSLLFGNGDGTFQPAVHLTVPGGNFWTALAVDVNGDDAVDLALSNDVLRGVTVLLGDGKGGFQLVGTTPIPPVGPTGLTSGDYNEDGVLDLVSANSAGTSFSVLLGNGDGTFLPASNYYSGGYPYEAATDDFNNDGHLDLVVMDAFFSGFNRFLGNGDGTFRAAVSYPPVHPRTADILTGDFDEDGNRDVVLADTYRGNTLTLYRGFGNGTFYPPTTTPAGNETLDVASGDFDGDGHEDLVSLHQNSGTIGLHYGNGNGTFQAMQSYPAAIHGAALISNLAVGDFNGDGFPDLAVTNQRANVVAVLLNHSTTDHLSIDAPTNQVATVAFTITVSARTFLDTIATGYRGTVTFESSDARATLPKDYLFTTVDAGTHRFNTTLRTQGSQTITVRDVENGELVATARVEVGPPPMFYPAVPYPVGPGPRILTAGDLNGDGLPDVVVPHLASNTVAVLLANPDGTLRPAVNYLTGSTPYHATIADINGDGFPDIVTANDTTGTISVLLGNGDGTFRAPLHSPNLGVVGGGGTGIADFNGDGYLDVAIGIVFSDRVAILLGNGDGTFRLGERYGTGTFAGGVGVGDYDGDGVVDLAVINQGSNTVSILLGNGDGTFRAPVHYATDNGPTNMDVGDVDGDGLLDVVTANYSAGTASVLFGNGDGTFRPRRDLPTGPGNHSVVIDDFNGDGLADIAAVSMAGNRISVLLGNGDGTFQAALTFPVGAGPISLAGGDFNADGATDLVVANNSSNTVSVLLNTSGRGGSPGSSSGGGDGGFLGLLAQRMREQPLPTSPQLVVPLSAVPLDVRRIDAVFMPMKEQPTPAIRTRTAPVDTRIGKAVENVLVSPLG